MIMLRILVLLVFLVPVPAFSAVPADNVVASVGGVPVTVFELRRQVDKVMPLRVSFHGGITEGKIKEVQKEALEELIERGYKIKYAIDNEVSVPVAKIDEGIAAVRTRFKTEQEFIKALGTESFTEFRAALYRSYLAEEAEKVAVAAKAHASDEEIKAYYNSHKHTFFMPKQFRASHIMIRVDPASNKEERDALKKRADELLVRAKAGEDFFDLAYFNSDDRTKFVGGDLGMFHEGQTEKAFEEELLKLKVGQISELVKTRFGYHIIKLTQVNEARQMSFEEMRLKVKERIEKDRRDKIYKDWIEMLSNKYKVERFVD